MFVKIEYTDTMYLQSTDTLICLLTVGGMPLLAMHKYAPISNLEIRVISRVSPSHSATKIIIVSFVLFYYYCTFIDQSIVVNF